jgi:c-di-GMP-binding flagellar brake protein YcgR
MDLSRLYSTRIKKSFDDDMADIVLWLKEAAAKGNNDLRLVNYYKGLPLCYPAQIVSVDRDTLELDIHQQQAVAIDRDRQTFIKCKGMADCILANAQYVNISKQAASLQRFTFVEIMAERRNAIRLELEPATDAAFVADGTTVNGQLFDLSINGAAVRIAKQSTISDDLTTSLQFMLPNLVQQSLAITKVSARLVGVTDEDDATLCRFDITPDKQVEQLLAQYIFQRQVELIRELKDAAL